MILRYADRVPRAWLCALAWALFFACTVNTKDYPLGREGLDASIESGAAAGAFGASGGATGRGGAGNQTGDGAAGAQMAGGAGGGAGTPSSGGATGTGGVGSASGGTTNGGTGGVGATGGGSGATGGSGGAAGASGAPFCTGTSVFCTDFNDGDISNWVPTGGSWLTVLDPNGISGHVYSGGGGSYVSSVPSVQNLTDQTVEARVYVSKFGGTTGSSYRAGIVARFAGGSSFYTLTIDADGFLRLLRGTSVPSGAVGACGAVASGLSSPTGTWMIMKLQVSGSSTIQLNTSLNGVPIHTCQSSGTVVTSGGAGVITNGTGTVADFDDFRVTQP